MRTLSPALVLFMGLVLIPAATATPKAAGPALVTVLQLDEKLAAAHGQSDADLAEALSNLELTERLSATRVTQLAAAVPGEKSREALRILADKSVFHDPPGDEIVGGPRPDPAATRQMLVQIVNYVNTTLRQLPNLIASRDTTGFEDRPREDRVEATGIVSLSYLPLHFVGRSNDTITFRDRKESVDDTLGKSTKEGRVGGMITRGEFGPILSTVLGDALKGKITWVRWEQGPTGQLAVFNFAVPEDKSHYRVEFCCMQTGLSADGQAELTPFNELSSYQGEITFNPADGSILRLMLKAELPAHGLVADAGLMVEYAPTEIAGKIYICRVKSVSTLAAHIQLPQGMFAQTDYRGATKTYLNDRSFSRYRRFGSEARILTGENTQPPQ
jgi:hypothetical protein